MRVSFLADKKKKVKTRCKTSLEEDFTGLSNSVINVVTMKQEQKTSSLELSAAVME